MYVCMYQIYKRLIWRERWIDMESCCCCCCCSLSMAASLGRQDKPPPLSHPSSSSTSPSHSSPPPNSIHNMYTLCPGRFFSFWDDTPANGFALPSSAPAEENTYCSGAVFVSDFPRNSSSESESAPHHTLLQTQHPYSMTEPLRRPPFTTGPQPLPSFPSAAASFSVPSTINNAKIVVPEALNLPNHADINAIYRYAIADHAPELAARTHFQASTIRTAAVSTSSYLHRPCLHEDPIFTAQSAYPSLQHLARPISNSVDPELLKYGAAGDGRDLCGFRSPPQAACLNADVELYAPTPATVQPQPDLAATTSDRELLQRGCVTDGYRNMQHGSLQCHDDHAAGVAPNSHLRYYYGDVSANRYTSCCSSNSNSKSQVRRHYNVLPEDDVKAEHMQRTGGVVDGAAEIAAAAVVPAASPPTGDGHEIAGTSRPRAEVLRTRNKVSVHPQGVAARRRRHRISNRFKALQTMVPGGAKMDTASMLDEAILYIKYLRAQILLHQLLELQQLSARPPLDYAAAAMFRQMKSPHSTAVAIPGNVSASTPGEARNPGSVDVNYGGGAAAAAAETAVGGAGGEFEAATCTMGSRYNYCSDSSSMVIGREDGNADDDVVIGPYYFHVTQRTSPLDHPS